MSDAKDYSTDGEDRDEWDRDWRAMPHRRLSSPPKIRLVDDAWGRLGDPVSFTISQNPLRFGDRAFRESECCPVCGERTSGEARLPATLHLWLAVGLGVGHGVWVHRACFECCPATGEPAPIPW